MRWHPPLPFSIHSRVISPRRFLISALLCLAACLTSCNRVLPAETNPESAANAFFASVANGDTRSAYDSSAFGFQAAQSYEAFNSNAVALGLIHAQPPVWTRKEIGPDEAKFHATVVNKSGAQVGLSIVLTPDAGAWKLFSLNTDFGIYNTASDNPFTLVGKGTGFNDVYHQPIPTNPEIIDLIHQTMTQFNSAVQKGDFHDFYNSVSQQWKDGARDTGQPAAGVTATMLKDHFQAFIDNKVDISPVLASTPVFDNPPIINPDGLLRMDGHFDGPAFRVNFSLEYAYELPKWKLFGINVNVTK